MFSKLFKKALTLIELSVVLIVLSILIGSVLISRKVIERAKVNNAVTEFVEMKKAISIFKDKYDILPGDLNQKDAQIFPDLWAYNADTYYARVPKVASLFNEKSAFAATTNAFYSSPSGAQASQSETIYDFYCQKTTTTYSMQSYYNANAEKCGYITLNNYCECWYTAYISNGCYYSGCAWNNKWFSTYDQSTTFGVGLPQFANTSCGCTNGYSGCIKCWIQCSCGKSIQTPATCSYTILESTSTTSYNKFTVSLDLQKLLVPTPPIYSGGSLIAGKDNNVGVIAGMIQSFYDAPPAPK